MNANLMNSLERLFDMHRELASLQIKLNDCENRKQTMAFPSPEDYFRQNAGLPRPPVEPAIPGKPVLSQEEYANPNVFINVYVQNNAPIQPAPTSKMILYAVLLVLGILSYMDAQYWNVLNEVFLLGIIVCVLEIALILLGIPAGIIGLIVNGIRCAKISKANAEAKSRSHAAAVEVYNRKRYEHGQYLYAMQVYYQQKAVYDRELYGYNSRVSARRAELYAEYRRRQPELRADFNRQIRDNDAEINRLRNAIAAQNESIGQAGLSIGLAERYAYSMGDVAELKRLVTDMRADTMPDAVNLLEQEKKEAQRLEYERQRTEESKQQTQYMRQQAMYQREQAMYAQEQAESEKERLEEQREYNQRQEEARERAREEARDAERARQDEARERGNRQCRYCKRRFDCANKYNNFGSCAAFFPD